MAITTKLLKALGQSPGKHTKVSEGSHVNYIDLGPSGGPMGIKSLVQNPATMRLNTSDRIARGRSPQPQPSFDDLEAEMVNAVADHILGPVREVPPAILPIPGNPLYDQYDASQRAAIASAPRYPSISNDPAVQEQQRQAYERFAAIERAKLGGGWKK
jgi:hypothetical protein